MRLLLFVRVTSFASPCNWPELTRSNLLGTNVPDERSLEEKVLAYLQVLLAEAGVVHSLLAELDPGFIICHFYNEMGNETRVQEIANFVAPTEVMAAFVKDSMMRHARPSDDSQYDLEFPGLETVVERIQQKLNVMEEQHCGAQALRRSLVD